MAKRIRSFYTTSLATAIMLAEAVSAAEPPAVTPKIEKLCSAIKARSATAEKLARSGDVAAARDERKGNDADIQKLDEALKDNKSDVDRDAAASAKASDSDAKGTISKEGAATCGGGQRGYPCFYVGAFVVSGSLASFSVGSLHGGKTSHAVVSTAIPALGLRIPIDKRAKYFSVEFGLLSMIASKDVTATAPRDGCKTSNGDFEKYLPCEGNVSITPIFAHYVGLTVGTTDIGVVSLLGMVGGATTSLDGSIRPYGGLAIGVANLSKTFNILSN